MTYQPHQTFSNVVTKELTFFLCLQSDSIDDPSTLVVHYLSQGPPPMSSFPDYTVTRLRSTVCSPVTTQSYLPGNGTIQLWTCPGQQFFPGPTQLSSDNAASCKIDCQYCSNYLKNETSWNRITGWEKSTHAFWLVEQCSFKSIDTTSFISITFDLNLIWSSDNANNLKKSGYGAKRHRFTLERLGCTNRIGA